MPAHPNDVIGYWSAAGSGKWFKKDARFDEAIRLRFEPVHHAAARGDYDGWQASAEGCLALLILLDQFPRNLWRGSGHAFATDPMARAVARKALALQFDQQISTDLRLFFYLPFEHSEDAGDQDLAIGLIQGLVDETGQDDLLRFAVMHRDLIARFGRFPHRNQALGRDSTPEEIAYLAEGGFSG